MKKTFTLLLVLTFLVGGLTNAQNQSSLSTNSNPNTKGTKAITEATITSSSNWINGTQILEFTMTYAHGDEYLDGLEMVFPAGMVPNVTGTSDPLTTPDGCGGAHLNLAANGQTLFWGINTSSGCGAYQGGTFDFQVTVTNTGLAGDQTINYTVFGDGSGSEPHLVTGSITIPKRPEHDLGIVAISPKFSRNGYMVTPKVTLQNNGQNNENNWSLTLTDGGSYTSTVSNINILVGESQIIDMDNWSPAEGNHLLTATLTMTNDENAANDTLTQTVSVGDFTIAFAWNVYHKGSGGASGKGPVNVVLETGAMAQIAIDAEGFVAGADYVGEEIYGTRYGHPNYTFVKIDPITGIATNISEVTPTLTGFAYDVTTETAYVIDFMGMLSTIDLETGTMTNIGGDYTKVMGLACDAEGNLFAISNDDHLARIDKTTGEHTLIGDLGININQAQDIAFDRINNILYGALYVETDVPYTYSGGIYTINTTTGAATLVVEVFDQLAGLAIPYILHGEPQTVSEIHTNQVTVYPNPSNGIINVQVSEKSIITLVDLTGRVIATYQVNGNETVSFNQTAAGIYILKVESKNQVSTHKLIIQ